jgi:WD40 repeat protein
MLLNQFHWLEIAEYLTLALSLISLLLTLASRTPIYPLSFILLALLLNVINRLRLQHLNRKRFAALKHQFSKEIETLRDKPAPKTVSPLPVEKNSQIVSLQTNLVNLEQSVQSITEYLGNYSLPERVAILEKSYAQLRQEILRLSQSLTEEDENCDEESNPLPALSPLSLSPIDLPEVLSTPPVSQWKCILTLREHNEAITSLDFNADGKLLASCSWDQTLRLWEVTTGNLINTTVAHSQGLLTVVFTSKELDLATGSFDQTIKLWSLTPDTQGKLKITLNHTLTAHTGSVHELAFAPEHELLISGSYDQTIKQWNPSTGSMVCSSLDNSGAVYAIAVAEEEEFVASAGGDGKVTLWELSHGEKLTELVGNISSVESLAISPDGLTVAAGCVDGTIKLWQIDSNAFKSGKKLQPVRNLSAHAAQVKALVFNRDDQTLLSSSADGLIKIWHPSSRNAIAVLDFTDDKSKRPISVFCLALSPDGKYLASGGADGTLKIWLRESFG